MKLEKLFRDVNSRITAIKGPAQVYALDVINAINDGIRRTIAEAITGRYAERVSVRETLSLTPDVDYPDFLSGELTFPVFSTTSIYEAILNARVNLENFNITTETSATLFQAGVKDNHIYRCLEAYSGGVQSKTFSVSDIRLYSQGYLASYKKDEVIRTGGEYWLVLQDFETDEVTFENGAQLEKIYWLKTNDKAWIRPMTARYNMFQTMMVQGPPTVLSTRTIAVNNKDVYVTPTAKSLFIEYVPEWVDVTELDDDIEVPTEWEEKIKSIAIQILAVKFGIQHEEQA
jgi:hypothetical protein